MAQTALNDIRGMANLTRVDEALYHDHETEAECKVVGDVCTFVTACKLHEHPHFQRKTAWVHMTLTCITLGRLLQQKREAREAKDQQALDKLISKVRVCLQLYEPEQAGTRVHTQQLHLLLIYAAW